MRHRLDPLLRPSSIAILGASARPGSYGRRMIDACVEAGFEGRLFLVNPNYDAIDGRPCYPDLGALPVPPEHCVLGVANERIEGALKQAIDAGAGAATIFGSCLIDDGSKLPLVDRLRAMARDAGILVCGGNCSGFYNRVDKVRCQMNSGPAEPPGAVTFISQSGSMWSAVSTNDGRLGFNLAVSSGHEITTDVSDYMDFALQLAGTRAIGLFIETIRNPERFIAVLERAAAADIPVVVNKIGRNEQSRRFAVSHSGALVGDDAVFDAVLHRYGGLRVEDPDELVATLQLLSTGRRATADGIVAITDSGGERELMADVAGTLEVPFATISEATRASLAGRVEYGLAAENPLDAWGTGHGFEEIFHGCMSALLSDPKAGLGVWVADLRDGRYYHESYADAAAEIAASSDKPLAFATCFSKARNSALALRLSRAGVPVLEGMRPAMVAVRRLLDHRKFQKRPPLRLPSPPSEAILSRWRARCAVGVSLDEAESLAMLADFGIAVVEHRVVESREAATVAAADLGFPVALKTAQAGIHHKSDVDGVRLALGDERSVAAAYDELAARLGPRALVSRMVSGSAEVALGLLVDPQFGPIVMIAAGGTLIEVMRDARFAVPPLDERVARELIDGLAIRSMLGGVRGRVPCDIGALARTIARFSMLIAALHPLLAELDVNPLIVGTDGAVAVDAMVVPAKPAESVEESG